MAAVTVNSFQSGYLAASFDITSAGTSDTFDFAAASAALPATAGAIKTFLSASHTDAAGTAAAFASNGVLFSAVGSGSAADVKFSGNNVIDGLAAGRYAVRFSLPHSICA